MIVVLSEESSRSFSVSARETQVITEAARMFGCRVYTIPPNFETCETAENALAHVPRFDTRMLGVWVGFIPEADRYKAIYDAALQKNIQLINSPEQHRTAMEFEYFYPAILDLTAKSIVIDDLAQLAAVPNTLAFPVFVKGSVKSNKEEGWNAVVAQNLDELTTIAQRLFSRPYRSRGKVIIRELLDLNIVTTDPNGFPLGREYRAFLYKNELLAYGFYWDDYPDRSPLSGEIRQALIAKVTETAKRVDVPFVSVDVGQLKNGEWVVIEIGDGQFSGLSQIPVLELWSKIKDFTL
jgi:hypothetical protein